MYIRFFIVLMIFFLPVQVVFGEEHFKEVAQEAPAPDGEQMLFVSFDPITIPIVTDDDESYRVRISYNIEVFDNSNIELVEAKKPKLTGEILQSLYQIMYEVLNENDKENFSLQDIDIVSLNSYLKHTTRKILPEDFEHDVYITRFSYRKL